MPIILCYNIGIPRSRGNYYAGSIQISKNNIRNLNQKIDEQCRNTLQCEWGIFIVEGHNDDTLFVQHSSINDHDTEASNENREKIRQQVEEVLSKEQSQIVTPGFPGQHQKKTRSSQ